MGEMYLKYNPMLRHQSSHRNEIAMKKCKLFERNSFKFASKFAPYFPHQRNDIYTSLQARMSMTSHL